MQLFINKLKQIDPRFFIALIVGISLRILALIFAPLGRDAYSYIKGAESILSGKYDSDRTLIFPLVILIFLLFTKNSLLSARLASFSTGILLIITSYLVFKKVSIEIFGNDDKGLKKSNNVDS